MSNIKNEVKSLKCKIWWFNAIAWALVAVGVGVLIFGIVEYNNEEKTMSLNELGDFLSGGTTSTWSLAGLFFIYVAFLGQKQQMIYQQKQLKLNNEDLELNREEIRQTNQTLSLQREEMTKQNITAERQQFENLFFNLVQTYNQIVNDLDVTFEYEEFTEDGVYPLTADAKGRDVFKDVYNIRIGKHNRKKKEAYGRIYNEFNSEFGHYYRFLYRIVNTIDKQNFVNEAPHYQNRTKEENEKIVARENYRIQYEYVCFVRSLLSDAELELLFLNMLYWEDLKFKPLIEKYCILKNISYRKEKAAEFKGQFKLGSMFKHHNPYLKELDENRNNKPAAVS